MIENYLALINELQKEWNREQDIINIMSEVVRHNEPTKPKVEKYNIIEWFEKRLRGEYDDEIIPTGFKEIDRRIFGAVKWNIMTIAARTWWGKTTLGINMATNMTLDWYKVWFISLEMTEKEMWDKIISRYGKIRLSTLTRNKYFEKDIENYKENKETIQKIIEWIKWDFNSYSIDEIQNSIEDMCEWWLDAVFVDWIGMIECPWQTRQEQIRKIMNTLKQLATQRNIAVVAMQQMNRALQEDTEPWPENIADWSAIEKISSPLILMWHSPSEVDTINMTLDKLRRINDTEFIWKPGRRNEFRTVTLRKNLWFCEFKDYEQPF